MEENLRIMIERFFNAELSVEEERELCRFMREHDVPAELRKDKEAIIALCGRGVEADLLPGADTRLEAMLDTIAENEHQYMTDGRSTSKAKRRIFRIPRFMWYGAAAAALVACYMFVNNDELQQMQYSGQTVNIAQVTASDPECDEPEKDTFDNPEDAMRCFKAAMGDIKLALNTTEKNTREIGDALNEAFQPYKNIIRINM